MVSLYVALAASAAAGGAEADADADACSNLENMSAVIDPKIRRETNRHSWAVVDRRESKQCFAPAAFLHGTCLSGRIGAACICC
jgi:hypothetical protein